MKIASILPLFFLSFGLSAQVWVSTDTEKRNVILEDFTGMHCPWSPDGAKFADDIVQQNPEDVFIISYHTDFYGTPQPGQPTHRNLITLAGERLFDFSQVNAIPGGNINRVLTPNGQQFGGTGMNRSHWSAATNEVINEDSPVNVAAEAYFDPGSTDLQINVSTYFTDTLSDPAYLHIAILQDSIIGYQSGGSTHYPGRLTVPMDNNSYRHMHVFREYITGDSIQTGDVVQHTNKGDQMDFRYVHPIKQIGPDLIPNMHRLKIVVFLTYDSLFGEIITGTTAKAGSRPVGMNELSSTWSLNTYPNPVNSELTVEAGSVQVKQINWYTTQGALVYQAEESRLGTFQLEVPLDLPNDVYLINMITDQGLTSKKVVVDRH